MADRVLVDEGKSDWALKSHAILSRGYSETLCVGEGSAPAKRSSDREIALFCKRERCDLLTGDKTAYVCMLDAEGVESVQISRYAVDPVSCQTIYLVKVC